VGRAVVRQLEQGAEDLVAGLHVAAARKNVNLIIRIRNTMRSF
jgi:hypothetical protein